MKITVKTTFDFGKLASNFPRILEKQMQRTARSSATGAREAIERGVSPKLKQSTLNRRKRAGTGGSKPLFETGKLFRSIKGTSEGLEMWNYGLYHHILKSFDAFRKDFRKALKK